MIWRVLKRIIAFKNHRCEHLLKSNNLTDLKFVLYINSDNMSVSRDLFLSCFWKTSIDILVTFKWSDILKEPISISILEWNSYFSSLTLLNYHQIASKRCVRSHSSEAKYGHLARPNKRLPFWLRSFRNRESIDTLSSLLGGYPTFYS